MSENLVQGTTLCYSKSINFGTTKKGSGVTNPTVNLLQSFPLKLTSRVAPTIRLFYFLSSIHSKRLIILSISLRELFSVKSGLIFFLGDGLWGFYSNVFCQDWRMRLFSVKTALIFCQCRVLFGKTRTIYRTDEVSIVNGWRCSSRTLCRTI